jgi:hypothetical protein
MQVKETIAFHSTDHKKHLNTLCGQISEFCYVEAGDA